MFCARGPPSIREWQRGSSILIDFGASISGLLPFILVGFAAQLVDGALGMAFGVIMNTLLVGVLVVPPAIASQRVHVVECFTTFTSAISHLLHRNIDKKLFLRLLVPGLIGGVGGAYMLSNLDAGFVKPFVLAYLTLIGLYLLVRDCSIPETARSKYVAPLGLVAALDAAGGGGWGRVTSNLLVQGAEPARWWARSIRSNSSSPSRSARLSSRSRRRRPRRGDAGPADRGRAGGADRGLRGQAFPRQWMLVMVGIG